VNPKLAQKIAFIILLLATILVIVPVGMIVVIIVVKGAPAINWEFLLAMPSKGMRAGGIFPAIVGTIYLVAATILFAIPVGVFSAIYLVEYARENLLTRMVKLAIINLAGVPSIVYGLFGLGLFVIFLGFGPSIIAGALTLAIMILPIIIVTTRESVRAIPISIREASYALGATQWQTIRDHILPYSTGGILTGIMIALCRAIGETAPLITIGALTFIAFLPHSLLDPFTVMPIQMFNWTSRPQEAFHVNAAATGIILLGMTLSMNAVAIYVRTSFRKKIQW